MIITAIRPMAGHSGRNRPERVRSNGNGDLVHGKNSLALIVDLLPDKGTKEGSVHHGIPYESEWFSREHTTLYGLGKVQTSGTQSH